MTVGVAVDKNGEGGMLLSARRLLEQEAIERLQVEESLRQSESKFRSIVQQSADGIVLTDEEGRVAEWNPAMERLTGLSEAEVSGRPVVDVICEMLPPDLRSPERCQQLRDRAAAYFRSGQAEWVNQLVEQPIQRRDGARRLVQQASFTMRTDKGFMLGNVLRDVTERRRMEEALRESETRLQLALTAGNLGIWEWNLATGTVTVSESTARLMGVSLEQFCGSYEAFVRVVHVDDRVKVDETIRRAIEEGVEGEQEFRVRWPDGSSRWLLGRGRCFYDARGVPLRLMGMLADVTERKWMEDALRTSEARSRAVLQALPDLVFVIDRNGVYLDFYAGRMDELILPPEGIVGAHLGDALPDEIVRRTMAAIEQALASGEMQTFEYVLDLPCGLSYREARVVPATQETVVVVTRDITTRKQSDEALLWRTQQLELLNRAGRDLNSTLELDQVLFTVLEEVRRLLDAVASSVWLVDDSGDLVCRQVTGPEKEMVRGWRLPPGQGIAGWVARHGQSVNVADAWADGRYFGGVDNRTRLGLRSILTVPLQVKGLVIGVLQVVSPEVGRFGQRDLELLEPLVAAAATAIENARLYEQARRDAEIKSVLLSETNHRVKNILTAVVGLLYAERRHAALEDLPVYQSIMGDLIARVQGLATVHSMLSASEWGPLLLSDLTQQIIRSALYSLSREQMIDLQVTPSTVRVTHEQAHNLALVINELATNAIKHGMGDRIAMRLDVDIRCVGTTAEMVFRDDGPGYPEDVLGWKRHGTGFDLIQSIVQKSLRGDLALANDGNGAVARLRFDIVVPL